MPGCIIASCNDAGELGLPSDVVAVIEGDRSAALQLEHRADVLTHRPHRLSDIAIGIISADSFGFGEAHPIGYVAVERIVGGGLIGEQIGYNAPFDQFREYIRAVG